MNPARGTCPGCGFDYALRANGTLGSHRSRTRQGYRLGYCPGVGKAPTSRTPIAHEDGNP